MSSNLFPLHKTVFKASENLRKYKKENNGEIIGAYDAKINIIHKGHFNFIS